MRSPPKLATTLVCLAAVVAALPAAVGQTRPIPGPVQPTTKPIVIHPDAGDATDAGGTETVVFFRHGEKPPHGLGQLTPQGLNRALALVTLLPARYGKPDVLFAPDPSLTKVSEGGSAYYYVRPLATIEPIAISLGMPVQTPFGFAEIEKLNHELSQPKYARSVVFVAWEHVYEQRAVADLVGQFGGDANQVPHWKGSDYDSLYVVRLTRAPGRATAVTFTLDHEGLDHLSQAMPAPAGTGGR